MSDYEYDSDDSTYDPENLDLDFYSDDSQLEEEAVGVSDEEVQPAGEEDPEGFHYKVPWTLAKMSYD